MATLEEELQARGHGYSSALSGHAQDIDFTDADELCEALGYMVKHVDHIDYEVPKKEASGDVYPIADGTTSGGNSMKYGREYRIYFDSTKNMPPKLSARLQHDGQNRLTGSRFVEACAQLGFQHGYTQNTDNIIKSIRSIFSSPSEQAAFAHGQTL